MKESFRPHVWFVVILLCIIVAVTGMWWLIPLIGVGYLAGLRHGARLGASR
jgi:hypothetical protein